MFVAREMKQKLLRKLGEFFLFHPLDWKFKVWSTDQNLDEKKKIKKHKGYIKI